MGYNRRKNRKITRDLVNKPSFTKKVVKEHNAKAKEQRQGDERFTKIVTGTMALVIGIILIVKYINQ